MLISQSERQELTEKAIKRAIRDYPELKEKLPNISLRVPIFEHKRSLTICRMEIIYKGIQFRDWDFAKRNFYLDKKERPELGEAISLNKVIKELFRQIVAMKE